MEKNKEDTAIFVIRVYTPVDTVEGEATTKVLNASSNIPGSVTRKREREVKKEQEEDQNQWNGINRRERH